MPGRRSQSRRIARALVALVAAATLPSASLLAQAAPPSCPAGVNRVAAVSGRRISAVTIAPRGLARLPGALGASLHVTTREATIRNRLLFAAGDSVDTLRVAESVRQLRRLRYLSGAVVTAACDTGGSVVLTVATRDAWSMKPRLSGGGSAGAVVGLEESNVLGTGRAVRVYARSDRGQFVVGAGYADPTLFGGRAFGTVSHDAYRNGGAWNAALRTKEVGVFERWGVGLTARQSARQSVAIQGVAPGDTVHRASAALLVRRRLTFAPVAATFLLAGVEAERTVLVAGADLPLAGPSAVRRTFAGLDLGLGRRTGRYDDVPWLLPQAGDDAARFAPAEIPVGVEGEAVVSAGRDFATQMPMARIDVWAGQVWHVGESVGAGPVNSADETPRALLSSDVWASGYRSLGTGGGKWSAGALRGSLALLTPATRGLWSARLSAERLVDPDPDVRSLTMADPAGRALPRGSRLAETAVSASLDRTIHFTAPRRGYVLDGAVFGAGSVRWDGASPQSAAGRLASDRGVTLEVPESAGSERLYVGSLGVGLRLTPTRFGRATIGLDVGFPVLRSPQVARRPYVGVSITPPFGAGRRRDGSVQ